MRHQGESLRQAKDTVNNVVAPAVDLEALTFTSYDHTCVIVSYNPPCCSFSKILYSMLVSRGTIQLRKKVLTYFERISKEAKKLASHKTSFDVF